MEVLSRVIQLKPLKSNIVQSVRIVKHFIQIEANHVWDKTYLQTHAVRNDNTSLKEMIITCTCVPLNICWNISCNIAVN